MTMSDAQQYSDNSQPSSSPPSAETSTEKGQQPLPLEGIRVLDCARLVAGGCIGTLLGDFGAEVVKIEAPGKGDPLRGWAVEKKEFWWKVYARNKKSMTLNLAVQEGRDILLEMIPHFDVMIEGFVPGKLESWGLSPEVLLKLNPGLVLVRASGWGQTGPYSSRPGFGTLIESMSGFAHMTGMPDEVDVDEFDFESAPEDVLMAADYELGDLISYAKTSYGITIRKSDNRAAVVAKFVDARYRNAMKVAGLTESNPLV
jgi:hypothetical protein